MGRGSIQGGNADEDACMVMVEKQIKQKYSDYASANGKHFAECAACLIGSGIRSELQKYWGGGSPYIDAIAENIWDELKRQSAVDKLKGIHPAKIFTLLFQYVRHFPFGIKPFHEAVPFPYLLQ